MSSTAKTRKDSGGGGGDAAQTWLPPASSSSTSASSSSDNHGRSSNEVSSKAPAATESASLQQLHKTDKSARQRTALYTENLPTFYVGPGNNAEL